MKKGLGLMEGAGRCPAKRELLALFFLAGEAEKRAVVFEEFADEEEGVESHDTIADQACDVIGLGIVLTLQEDLVPEGGELGVVFLEFIQQFVFSLTKFLQGVVFAYGLFDGQHLTLKIKRYGYLLRRRLVRKGTRGNA